MKIAYILYPEVIISNKSNGVRSQAETWADLLRANGHMVDYVSTWENYNWKEYDVIHLFGGGKWVFPIVKRLSAINPKICWSPIYDPVCGSFLKQYVISHIRQFTNRSIKQNNYLFQIKNESCVKTVLTRSDFESDYLNKIFNVPKDRIAMVPLSYSNYCKPYVKCNKEDFCLHISSIYQPRKNVIRLIEAANKYNFKLVLAGNKGSEKQFEPIRKAIGSNKNINVLGFVSEEEKINLYRRAKVFALPSLSEGVGIVAVDAAYYGCEIVITNISGPKEYYAGQCIEVNPLDVDAIGVAVTSFLKNEVSFQPHLAVNIKNEFAGDMIVKKIINVYNSMQ